MRCLVLCATLAAGFPRLASAQSISLTEAQALERLTAESPRVRAIQAGVDVARAEILAAGRWPNPRFSLTRESVAGVTEYLTTVGQPLPLSGERGLQVQAAKARAAASEGLAAEALRRARLELRVAFGALLTAQVRQQEMSAARERLRALADVLAKREAAGDAAGFDRLRAEREVIEVDAELASAASAVARAQGQLASFLSRPIDVTQIVAVAADTTAAIPALDALIAHAESNRGDVQAVAKELEAAQYAVAAAERRVWPEPEIVAGTKSSTVAESMGSVFGVQLNLPLFDRGKPERAVAEAKRRQVQARAEALRLQIRAELVGVVGALQARRDAAATYRSAALVNADEVARIAQVSYDAGERGILELLDAYRLAASARIRQAALDAAVREAEIELESVSGWEIRK